MLLIFKLYLDICLMRANAEDVPASRILMILTICVYFALSLAVTVIDNTLGKAVSTVLVGLVMMIGFAQAGLWVRSFMNRSMQTVTALAGTGIVFDLMSWPLILLASRYTAEQLMFPRFLLLLLLFWNIAVIGHILRNALSIPFWAGLGISVLYVFTYLRVVRVLLTAAG
jgi:hypothetical protein